MTMLCCGASERDAAAIGTKRTSLRCSWMSAFGVTADIVGRANSVAGERKPRPRTGFRWPITVVKPARLCSVLL